MASIPKASTLLLKICLLLITAINIAAADRRSVLSELYKQASEQNRPLILVVDNHSKNDGDVYQSRGVYKGSRHESDEATPIHYMYPKGSISQSKSVNVQGKYADKDSKLDVLKFYLSRLLSQNEVNRGEIKKNVGRSDDRYDARSQDNRYYYNDDRDQRDRRDQYRLRERDTNYNRRPIDRYYRPRENREYQIRGKYYSNRPEDSYRYDRDRYDRDRRDRYRSERDSEYGDRVDRYRSEKYRDDRDRADRYRQDRNKGRDNYRLKDLYKDDRDQYQSQKRYQQPRNKDRYTDNYGADVLKNLLRISNDLNCDAKYSCKSSCYQRARILRQSGDNCEDLCDKQFQCEESQEKKVEKKPKGDDCDGRGASSESCGDEKSNGNVSTRGYADKDDEDECGEKGNRC